MGEIIQVARQAEIAGQSELVIRPGGDGANLLAVQIKADASWLPSDGHMPPVPAVEGFRGSQLKVLAADRARCQQVRPATTLCRLRGRRGQPEVEAVAHRRSGKDAIVILHHPVLMRPQA